jgi:hypothetical protein
MTETPLALAYIRAVRDDRTLSTTEKLTAMTMASHAGHDGMNAHPGQKLLGDETSTSERTARRVLDSLVTKGWLVQTSSGRGNSRYASSYRIAIPQPATDGLSDIAPTGQAEQANRPNETSQPAIHGLTNQPVEITNEIPSQVTDLTVGCAFDQDQGLTDEYEGSPSDSGEAEDAWTDCPSGEDLVAGLNEVLEREWPREDNPEAEPFDPRFLRGGAQRLAELVQAVNRNRFDMDALVCGMFITSEKACPEAGRARHNPELVSNPARIIGKVMSGPIHEFVAYGLRGKKIFASWSRQGEEVAKLEEAAA